MEYCLFLFFIAIVLIFLCLMYNGDKEYFNVSAALDQNNNKLNVNYLKHYQDVTGFIAAQPRDNIIKPYYEKNYNQKQDDVMDFSLNMCSPNCCNKQFHPPFALAGDFYPYDDDKYVSSSYACNNSFQNSGCLCMTKNQSEFLGSRGLNA